MSREDLLGGRLISDILQISDNLKIKRPVMILDIKKAFDSVNHVFLITALEKYGFKEDFIKWKQFLIQNQESCGLNEETATSYFKFERGTGLGYPISAYISIHILEIEFLYIIQNENINGRNIFEKTSIHSLCRLYCIFS